MRISSGPQTTALPLLEHRERKELEIVPSIFFFPAGPLSPSGNSSIIKVDRLAQPAVSTYLDEDLPAFPKGHLTFQSAFQMQIIGTYQANAFFSFGACSGLWQGADAA